MKWNGEMPCDKYLYASREVNESTQLEWHHLDEADPHIQALLRWVFDFYVVFPSVANKQICCYEQLVFEVLNATFEPLAGSKWGLKLEVFNFWDHTPMVYYFCLAWWASKTRRTVKEQGLEKKESDEATHFSFWASMCMIYRDIYIYTNKKTYTTPSYNYPTRLESGQRCHKGSWAITFPKSPMSWWMWWQFSPMVCCHWATTLPKPMLSWRYDVQRMLAMQAQKPKP